MATIYTHASANIRKTWLLLSLLFVFLIGFFWVLSYVWQNPAILWFGAILAIVMNVASYWFSDKFVIALAGARPVDARQMPELYRIVENLAITAGLPMPKLYVIQDPSPNAFATGRNPKHAVVAVTTGLMERLDRTELEGVIAHELSHIGNRDMLISTVVVVVAGIISILSDFFLRMSFFGGMRNDREGRGGGILMLIAIAGAILAPFAALLIRLAISRRREYLADASGALLTRYPEGLALALAKIAGDPRPVRNAHSATAHLYFENPYKADAPTGRKKTPWLVSLFMTHPPVEDRIKALRSMNPVTGAE
ncbi:zinc metalloprotease HtpX [Candidatus Parcubacteria bacterium]|nr:MAG: zinc metalloprotease HtpX [Candidatus Parcubacteria bacterium]